MSLIIKRKIYSKKVHFRSCNLTSQEEGYQFKSNWWHVIVYTFDDSNKTRRGLTLALVLYIYINMILLQIQLVCVNMFPYWLRIVNMHPNNHIIGLFRTIGFKSLFLSVTTTTQNIVQGETWQTSLFTSMAVLVNTQFSNKLLK